MLLPHPISLSTPDLRAHSRSVRTRITTRKRCSTVVNIVIQLQIRQHGSVICSAWNKPARSITDFDHITSTQLSAMQTATSLLRLLCLPSSTLRSHLSRPIRTCLPHDDLIITWRVLDTLFIVHAIASLFVVLLSLFEYRLAVCEGLLLIVGRLASQMRKQGSRTWLAKRPPALITVSGSHRAHKGKGRRGSATWAIWEIMQIHLPKWYYRSLFERSAPPPSHVEVPGFSTAAQYHACPCADLNRRVSVASNTFRSIHLR